MPRKNILTLIIFLAAGGLGVFGGAIKVSATEFLGRGLLCLPKDGSAYCSWRLLPIDAPTVGFDVYRDIAPTGSFAKINGNAITASTNFHDTNAQSGTTYYYKIKPVGGGFSEIAKVTAGATKNYLEFNLGYGATSAHSVVPADLNGDGVLDFVVKSPNYDFCSGSDPTATQKISVFINENGAWTPRWNFDSLVQICASSEDFAVNPLLAWDLDGDKKAEIVSAYGANNKEFVILSGETGEVLAREDWPEYGDPRADRRKYGTIARLKDMNGDGVADPFIVFQSGLYASQQRFSAFYYNGATKVLSLEQDYKIIESYYAVSGRGTHGLPAADIDLDGEDEIIPCGLMLESDFSVIKQVNTKHNDACYIGEIRPELPGLETFMGTEQGYIAQLIDKDGNELWKRNAGAGYDGWEQGWCSELSTSYAGLECFAYEKDETEAKTETAHIFSAGDKDNPSRDITSELITNPTSLEGIRQAPLDWNGGEGLKELYFHGNPAGVSGASWYHSFWGDIFGDSREEVAVFTANNGKFRIYSNNAVNDQRYVTPLADRDYRAALARVGVGYRGNYVPSKSGQTRNEVVYVANFSTCSQFTYSAWEDCQSNGTRKRAVVLAEPSGCTGGNPITTETCVYAPPACNETKTTGTYFDAENFTGTLAPALGKGTFSMETSKTGYLGSGYLKANGDGTGEGKEYAVDFKTAGNYTVWMRSAGMDGFSDSVYIGLDGAQTGAIQSSQNGNWGWNKTVFSGTNVISVANVGVHKFNIWLREGNQLIDGIYLTAGAEAPTDLLHGNVINPASCSGQSQTCASFAYSAWTPVGCPQNQTQTKTIISSSPSGCVGGTPESLTRSCVYKKTYTIQNFKTLLPNWLKPVATGNSADLNGDTIVNSRDLGIMMSSWSE